MDNLLTDVAVVSSDDAWAIGAAYEPQEGGRTRSLILHWDGSRWRIARPPLTVQDQALYGISADAADDAWIVGAAPGATGLAWHWDGSSWSEVPLADPGTRFWHLTDVAALSLEDAWAVGNTATGHSGATLVEHWDGTRWSILPSPSPPPRPRTGLPYAGLDGIDVEASLDGWAVGESVNVSGDGASNTLTEHWDGQVWSTVSSADVNSPRGLPFDHLSAIAAVSPEDAWAFGSFGSQAGLGYDDRALIEHWDGTSWSIAETFPKSSSLSGAVAISPTDVWAVGAAGNLHAIAPLIEHWDGLTWSKVVGTTGSPSELFGVGADHFGNLWAVGSLGHRHPRTLAMRCSTAA